MRWLSVFRMRRITEQPPWEGERRNQRQKTPQKFDMRSSLNASQQKPKALGNKMPSQFFGNNM